MSEQQTADMAHWQQRCREALLGPNPLSLYRLYLEHTQALEEDVATLQAEVARLRRLCEPVWGGVPGAPPDPGGDE